MTQNQVSTLRKGLLVLELIKDSQGITLSEVMHKQKMSKSTAFRALTTLEEMNYIYKIQTKYFFNAKMFQGVLEEKATNEWASLHSIYQMAHHINMSTYLGKVILAHMDETKLNALLNKMSLEPATSNTFQDSQLFRYHLKAIHEDGYAFVTARL